MVATKAFYEIDVASVVAAVTAMDLGDTGEREPCDEGRLGGDGDQIFVEKFQLALANHEELFGGGSKRMGR